MNSLLQYFLIGMLGLIFHQGIKIDAMRKRVLAANETWSFKNYLHNEWTAILVAIIALIIAIVLQTELIQHYERLSEWINLYLITMGYMGSSLFQALLSKKEKQILKIIDRKTDIADNKEVS
jgi:hypothetical protein